jgi:eukaryotic-like serine/threonine-protein kinase
VLLAGGGAREALGAASEAKEIADSLRGLAEGEALIRAVHAEALAAAGYLEAARAAAGEARTRLLSRAEKIRDPARRQSFLESAPVNARTLALAERLA